jgi:catechol 2,3-dioxygenase-like lactoylglutathione lyase family enzyme
MTDTSCPGSGENLTGLGSAVAARSFDHVGLSVPDLDSAVDFFATCFGARVLFAMARPADRGTMVAERLGVDADAEFALVMLELGGKRIELLQWWPARSEGPAPKADQPGGSHVAIEVADVASAVERLRRISGVEVVGEPMTFGAGATPALTNCFVRTPWGALIELVCWHWQDI